MSTASNALAQIQGDFQRGLTDWAVMQNLEGQISLDQKQAAQDKTYWHWHTQTLTYNNAGTHEYEKTILNHADIDQYHALTNDIKVIESQQVNSVHLSQNDTIHIAGGLNGLAEDLENVDPGVEIKQLLGALEQINVGFSANGNSGYTYLTTSTTTEEPNSSKEITSQESVLKTLCTMITDQLAIDQQEAVAQNSQGNNTSADVLAAIQAEDPQLAIYNTLETQLATLSANATQDIANVNHKETHQSGFYLTLFGGPSSQQKAEISQDNNIVGAAALISTALAGFAATAQSEQEFASVVSVIAGLCSKIEALLANPKLSTASTEKVCGMIQVILGYLQIVLQTAENLRTKNQLDIDKANLHAQQANIKLFTAAIWVINHLNSIQKTMQVVQKVAVVVELVLVALFIATGNFGDAIALGTVMLASKEGWLQDLQNDIAEHTSEAIATVTVFALTMAGSLAISGAVSKIAGAAATKAAIAAKEIATDSEEAINTAVSDALKAAKDSPSSKLMDRGEEQDTSGTGDQEMTDMGPGSNLATGQPSAADQAAQKAVGDVETLIRKTLKKILTKVEQLTARNAMEQYARETSLLTPTRLKDLIATANPFSTTVAPEIAQVVKTSISDATREALLQAPALLAKIAKGTISQAEIDTLVEAIAQDASSSANATLRQATDFDAISAAKADPGKGALEQIKWALKKAQNPLNGAVSATLTKALTRAVSLSMFAQTQIRGTIKLPIDGNAGKALNIIFEILQGFGQGMMMAKASGCGEVMASEASGKILAGAFMAQIAGMILLETITGSGNVAQGQISKRQAQAVKEVDRLQAFNTVSRTIFDRTQDLSPSNSPFQAYERHLQQDIAWMEAHQFDGINEGCRVLSEQSV